MAKKVIIISGPSGSGKTTISHNLLKQFSDLMFSVSATTRSQRPNETDGKDYHFMSENEFRKRIKNKEFAEWEEVYHGMFYGTLLSEIDRIWKLKKTAVFDVDVVGALNLKQQLGKKALALFVMPPSMKHLEQRLKSRKTESDESLERRLGKAEEEIKLAKFFDAILINEHLATSFEETEELIASFLKKK